jgi:putative glutamine amidotransferase
MAPPVIGICAVRERARWAFWDQTAHLVADTYIQAVQGTGAAAVMLPVDERAPGVLLDRIDGLLLIGGADVDPASYGAEREPATESTYPDRDAFEIALTLAAIERGTPYLGICRGMQILNVALGGTLRQEIARADGWNPHRKRVGSFEGTEHEIRLEPGSLAALATAEEVHVAHCHHHQAVDRIGRGLVVSGRANDDVPEAIELEGDAWVLGVQWHPEAADKAVLFQAFTDAALSPDGARRRTRGAAGPGRR